MTKEELISMIQSLRVDAILEENDLDQDELGAILGVLGETDFKRSLIDYVNEL